MARLILRLYVAGDGPNSVAARTNIRRLLAHCEPSTYSLEIVDCLREPTRTLQEGVLVTPTLVRFEPKPGRTIIGTLSDSERVLETLGIDSPAKVSPV
jgi:circadian clock protein KaiB